MKFLKKIILFSISIFITSSLFAIDLTQFTTNLVKYKDTVYKLNKGLDNFSEQLSYSVPLAASHQNIWADAYIGKVFPSVLPHFGGGVNLAAARIDTSDLADVAKILGIDNIKNNYYFPVFTADLRVGGLLLPFDFDIAVMKTGTISADVLDANIEMDFMTLAFDFRYAILKGNVLFPKLSVGAGYIYSEGSLSAGNKDAEASIDYKSQTLYGQIQLSKKFLFITPFVGMRGLVSKCDNSYKWSLKGDSITSVKPILDGWGVPYSGFGSYKKDSFDLDEIQPQFFAGIGFNLFVLQATMSVSADLKRLSSDKLWAGAFSLRLKL